MRMEATIEVTGLCKRLRPAVAYLELTRDAAECRATMAGEVLGASSPGGDSKEMAR